MLQGHYWQILTKYDQLVTKYYQNDQIHLEKIQERNFVRIKKTMLQGVAGRALGYRGLGVYMFQVSGFCAPPPAERGAFRFTALARPMDPGPGGS